MKKAANIAPTPRIGSHRRRRNYDSSAAAAPAAFDVGKRPQASTIVIALRVGGEGSGLDAAAEMFLPKMLTEASPRYQPAAVARFDAHAWIIDFDDD